MPGKIHDIFNNPEAKASDFVNLNNKLIDDNILIRRQWEDDAKLVSLSYNGNKHPVLSYKRGDKTTKVLSAGKRMRNHS